MLVTAGDPDGVRVVDKSNWTGRGVVFSRADLPAAAEQGLNSPGVYVLIGDDPDETFDQQVYVGQGEDIAKRLASHQRDDGKDFWTDTVVFVSSRGSLNRAHILHLESRLIGLLHDARRARVANGNRPSAPSLTPSDHADAEGFLAEMLAIFPVLGVDVFDRPAPTTAAERHYFLDERNARGEAVERSEGFVLLEGSMARLDEAPSIQPFAKRMRAQLLADGRLLEGDGGYRLTEDVRFRTPSGAASVLVAAPINGRVAWKDADGVTLKHHQAEAAGPADDDVT